MVEIASGLAVPESELAFETSRSGGPGGQNVNKVESRVTLFFDLGASTSLSAEQKARIRERLATRISRGGVLRVVSSRHRTQGANKKAVLERLVELLQDALEVPAERRPTRVPARARRRRLEAKRLQGEKKRQRADGRGED